MTTRRLLILIERQFSANTQLRRAVALFQRKLGEVFGNASVKRRNRRYELDVAVYEKPVANSSKGYKMPTKQILVWVNSAARAAHPDLCRRIKVDVQPWRLGKVSHKLFSPVKIIVEIDGVDNDSV